MKLLAKLLVIGIAVLAALFVLDRIGLVDVPNPFHRNGALPPAVRLPEAQPYQPPPSSSKQPENPSALPQEVNLAIPFTVQAPFANWDKEHEDFCEEASVLMATSYVLGKEIPNPEFADERMQEIREFEIKRFGYFESTTAEETAVIVREYYGIAAVTVVENPAEDTIRNAVASGKAVLIPAAGRAMGNPYFQQPGPLYHMLVVKGYTKNDWFITNDPGTKHGADYLYDPAVLMNAIHDWNSGNVESGRSVIIIIG